MVKPLNLVKALDATTPTIDFKREKPKSRRQRRKEQRNALRNAKTNQRKAG